jgi:anti-sigma factor (TIGR02949 family)
VTRPGMSCEEVLHHLFAYLDGELDALTGEDIQRHLEACRGCFSRAEFERRLKARLAEAATVEAPEKLRRRVRLLIERF